MTVALKFVPLKLAAVSPDQAPTLGIIADTHGLLRPEAVPALNGCHGIIHAGDLGKLEVCEALSRIAPTVAIRGNVDRGPWAKRFPETLAVSAGGVNIYVTHDLKAMTIDPSAEKAHVVISGHSHHPAITEKLGVLYVNPGSAGPRRFSLPVTVVRIRIGSDYLQTDLVDLLTGTVVSRVKTARRACST